MPNKQSRWAIFLFVKKETLPGRTVEGTGPTLDFSGRFSGKANVQSGSEIKKKNLCKSVSG